MPTRFNPEIDPYAQYQLMVDYSPTPSNFTASVFGRNPDIDSGGGPEDLWHPGGQWVAPTAARIHDVSGAAQDVNTTGTGAWSVLVDGLDTNYDIQSEIVLLNGATAVPTVNSYVRINRMIVVNAGSTGSNVGSITATAQVDATITSQIAPSFGRAVQAIFTIPNNMRARLTSLYGSIIKTQATTAELFLYGRQVGGAWQSVFFFGLETTGSTTFQDTFDPPPILFPKTDLRMQGDVGGNNTIVAGGFQLALYHYDP